MWLALALLGLRGGAYVAPPRVRRAVQPQLALQSSFPSPGPSERGAGADSVGALGAPQSSAHPLRTMVFIDGSWLYYSFHGRRPTCPVTSQYGEGWEYGYSIDFDRLPQLISQYIQTELLRRSHSQRFVEVVRTVVFSSARADTHHDSTRMRMFRNMEAANFEVHMSVTTGYHEKCIDISLAVEMLHYATVPGAYDVAVLVSGDKDFIPALARIRQKGKRVAVCSMRNCCSRDLNDPTTHCRDFDLIWLDDHLEYLIRPTPGASLAPGAPVVAVSELLTVVKSFLAEEGKPVSSRDIGRQLQRQMINGRDALSQLKHRHGGLRAFITDHPDTFAVEREEEDERGVTEFFVRLTDKAGADALEDSHDEMVMDAKIGNLQQADNGASGGTTGGELLDDEDEGESGGSSSVGAEAFERMTVPQLRSALRERGLRAIGRRADLLERLHEAVGDTGGDSGASNGVNGASRGGGEAAPAAAWSGADAAMPMATPAAYGGAAGAVADMRTPISTAGLVGERLKATAAAQEQMEEAQADIDETRLQQSVVTFLTRSGGSQSSRNVGRHLAQQGLLAALKAKHAGLFHFLQRNDELFRVELPSENGALEYQVHLKK